MENSIEHLSKLAEEKVAINDNEISQLDHKVQERKEEVQAEVQKKAEVLKDGLEKNEIISCKGEEKAKEAIERENAKVEKDNSEANETEKGSKKEKSLEEKKKVPEDKKGNFLRQFRSGSSGFKKFTASQFMQVWNHFDNDGNGYIEDHELDGFLKEFVLSSCSEGETRPEVLSDSAMAVFRETFMDAFDENQDGKIDIQELAEILPTDENFLLLFHLKNPLESSVEFMKIWKKFDQDCKGYIETTELKPFLKHMLDNQKTSVSDEKLAEYTETILNLFDSNRDGKLQLAEMSRLMPVKHNLLSKPFLKGASCITRRDVDRLFKIYDQDNNGSIEGDELNGLLKDLLDLGKKEATLEDLEKMKDALMQHWDVDNDNSISKSELRMFLIQHCKMLAEAQGIEYEDESDDD